MAPNRKYYEASESALRAQPSQASKAKQAKRIKPKA